MYCLNPTQSHETLKAEFYDQKNELALKSQDNPVLLHEKNHLQNTYKNLPNLLQARRMKNSSGNNSELLAQLERELFKKVTKNVAHKKVVYGY